MLGGDLADGDLRTDLLRGAQEELDDLRWEQKGGHHEAEEGHVPGLPHLFLPLVDRRGICNRRLREDPAGAGQARDHGDTNLHR